MNEYIKKQITSGARWVLGFVGGFLIAKGVDSEVVNAAVNANIELVVGAGTTVVAAVWAWVKNKVAPKSEVKSEAEVVKE